MSKLNINDNIIEIKDYCKIYLGKGKSNIYNIFGLSSEGKSKLMQDIIDLDYSNVKVYSENEIEPEMLRKFKNNNECDIIFLDDVSIPKIQSKELIEVLSELNQIIIIIDRIINRYSVNYLEVKQENNIIIIDGASNLRERIL